MKDIIILLCCVSLSKIIQNCTSGKVLTSGISCCFSSKWAKAVWMLPTYETEKHSCWRLRCRQLHLWLKVEVFQIMLLLFILYSSNLWTLTSALKVAMHHFITCSPEIIVLNERIHPPFFIVFLSLSFCLPLFFFFSFTAHPLLVPVWAIYHAPSMRVTPVKRSRRVCVSVLGCVCVCVMHVCADLLEDKISYVDQEVTPSKTVT